MILKGLLIIHVRTIILEELLTRDEIKDSREKGIARRAIEIGYENLTDGRSWQKYVLKEYFEPICEGDDIHQDCNQKLSDKEHLEALTEVLLYEKLSCSKCRNQMDNQRATWSRIQN